MNISQATYEILSSSSSLPLRVPQGAGGEIGEIGETGETGEIGEIGEDLGFVFEGRWKIDVKGKGEMEMYFVSLKNEY